MNLIKTLSALLLVFLFSRTVSAQQFVAEERTIIINPTNSVENREFEGLSLANHEAMIGTKIPVGSEKIYIPFFVRASYQQLDGAPPAGFIGLGYSPHKNFDAEASIGIAATRGELTNQNILGGVRTRTRGAVRANIPLAKTISAQLNVEMEMGGQNIGDPYNRDGWWNRKSSGWARTKLILKKGPVGIGGLYESSAGTGGIAEIAIPETPIKVYVGLLFSGGKRYDGDEVIKKGSRVWAFGIIFTG
ncbi:MAG: hypothetical protein Q7R98_00695 [Candidatus Jorgensenbacteria bacterium]|nr:hypothetical protein [Candidatus Jorgensenbacteria bacterium]